MKWNSAASTKLYYCSELHVNLRSASRKKPPIKERCDSRMHAFTCMNVCLFVWDWISQILWWIRIRMRSTEARVNDSSFAISIYLFKIDLLRFTVCHADGMLSCCDLIIIIFVHSFCILFLFVFIFFSHFCFRSVYWNHLTCSWIGHF